MSAGINICKMSCMIITIGYIHKIKCTRTGSCQAMYAEEYYKRSGIACSLQTVREHQSVCLHSARSAGSVHSQVKYDLATTACRTER